MNDNKPTGSAAGEDEAVTYTTAPADYDWFGTRELGEAGLTGPKSGGRVLRVIRKVAGPKKRVDAQRDRYASGNHMAVDETEWQKLVGYGLVEAYPSSP